MLRNRKRLFILILALTICLSSWAPAFANSISLFKPATTINADEFKFKLEVPDNSTGFIIQTQIIPWDSSKIPQSDKYYVTRAFELRMLNGANTVVNYLDKPLRFCFYFDEVDFKRASNLDTSQPLGHFQAAYWNESTNDWKIMPAVIYWDGSQGVLEGSSNYGNGKYALIWDRNGSNPLTSFGEDQIRILANFNLVTPPFPPYIKDGKTMVPLRVIATALGVTVNWSQSEQRIDLVKGPSTVSLWVGDNHISKNGVTSTVDSSPEIVNGSTYVPLRLAVESLGASVEWEQLTRTAKIISK